MYLTHNKLENGHIDFEFVSEMTKIFKTTPNISFKRLSLTFQRIRYRRKQLISSYVTSVLTV